MPGEDDVLINFVGNTDQLKPVEEVLDGIVTKGDEVGEAWKKTSAIIAAANAANLKGLKAIEDLTSAQLKNSATTNKLLEDLNTKISKLGTAYETVTVAEQKMGQQVDKTNKSNVEGTTKFTKSIQDLAVATQSMDKAVIGGAYKNFLNQIQTQLGLTNKELVSFITNARASAREAIFTAQTEEEVNQLTLSIETMNEQLTALSATEVTTGDKSESLRSRIREVKDELLAMQDAGLSGTAAFQELQQNAVELQEQANNLNKTLHNLGSDTKNIDGVISLLSGVAGGFAVAQGTAALFGEESEDVQKALLKVNAAMSILQGLQQFQNVLQEKSSGLQLLKTLFLRQATVATTENTVATEANVVAEGESAAGATALATAEGAQAVATDAATESQIALNTAMELNPIAIVIAAVVALTAALAYLATNNHKAAEEQVNLNDALHKATEYLDIDLQTQERINDKLVEMAKQRGASVIELASIEGKAGLERLKIIDDARVAAAKAYNESVNNDKETIESRQKLYDKIFALDNQYQAEKHALEIKGVEFEVQRDAEAFKSFVAFQQAKVAATIAGTDAERSAEIASLKEIAAQREFSAEFIALTDGEKAQKRAEDEKQIQGLQLANYQHYLKGRTSLDEAYVADAKLKLVKNQTDTIASINAVTDAEIEALKKRQTEALSNPTLNAGEQKKIIAETNLAIIEAEKSKQLKILQIEKAEIADRLAAAIKGTSAEYNFRLQAITNEQQIALAATELTAGQIAAINEKYERERQEASRAFQEVQLQNQISLDNALLAQFGITEKEKLSVTLKRLDEQRALEISQAEENGAKIVEINAKYDKQIIDEKKASINAILADNIKTLNVFSDLSNQRSQRTIDSPASSNNDKVKALQDLQAFEDQKFDLEHRALTKQVEDNLLTNAEFNVAYQDLLNRKQASATATEKAITALELQEIGKRTAAIQATFDIFQKGLSATLGNTGLSTALTELQNFGVLAQDTLKKIKLGTLSTAEGMKLIATAAIAAMQSVTNQLFSDQAAARQQILADTIQTLEDQKAKELNNKALTEEQKAEIDKKYKEKERQEKIKAFIADKEAKKEQAIINGLLAVTNALATAPTIIAGVILAALVAASTAIQVAKINSTPVPKFRHGKVDIQGPGTATSDSIPAQISKGESVITAEATAKWKGALEAMNSGKFEDYLINKLRDFIFPEVPDHIQPAAAGGQHIDYDKLSTAIAEKMRGIMPGHKTMEFNIDQNGIRTIVREGNSRTEYKNKRYSVN